MGDHLLDINDVSALLKVPVKTIRNKLSDGTWPLDPLRIGRSLRWPEAEVRRVMRGEIRIPSSPAADRNRREPSGAGGAVVPNRRGQP